MKSFLKFAKYVLLILGAVLINFLLWHVSGDGRPVDRMLISVLYLVPFSVMLFLVAYKRSTFKRIYIIFLILVFPSICLKGISSGGDPFRSSSNMGYEIEVCGLLGSIVNLFSSFNRAGNENNVLSNGTGSHMLLMAYHMYSILLALGIAYVLLRFKENSSGLYNKAIYWVLTGIAFIAGYIVMGLKYSKQIVYPGNSALWHTMFIYLLAYVMLLVIYMLLRKNRPANRYKIVALILILLFPAISISPYTVNSITADTVAQYTGTIGIIPLASALPITIKQLIEAFTTEVPQWPFSVMLYTLLQGSVVLSVFSSVLISKNEKNG